MSDGERRVSTLEGDRPCVRCGYNLTGQPIVREPHYDMLIARCPECGTVAGLQEYPVLGRWASRWATLVAALWFAALIGLTFACTGLLYAICDQTVQAACEPFALFLAKRQIADIKDEMDRGQVVSQMAAQLVNYPPAVHTMMESTWLSQQDFEVLLAEAGGWAGAIDLGARGSWGWVALVAFGIGCGWSVILLHVRRRRVVAFALVPIGLAVTGAAIELLGGTDPYTAWGWIPAISLAERHAGRPLLFASFALALVPMSMGLVLGRPIVRGLVRALLPPRLRAALALLWTVEGLEPPPGGRGAGRP